MHGPRSVSFCLLAAVSSAPASAQQARGEAARGSVPAPAPQGRPGEATRGIMLDRASIQREAARLSEFRAMLADPDPNVRLLVMREAMRAGDGV